MTRRRLVGLLAPFLVMAGCAGATPGVTASTSPVVAATPPPGGVLLTAIGFPDAPRFFTNAPPGFAIPDGVQPVSGANLPELVNVVFAPFDGRGVHDFLTTNLAAMGCPIQAQSGDSVTWRCGSWDGAFTMTAEQAGLTLRLAPGS